MTTICNAYSPWGLQRLAFTILLLLLKVVHRSVMPVVVADYCCAVNESLLWSKSLQGLDPFIYAEIAQAHILDYKFFLPLRQLRAGLKYYGSAPRLRRFVTDLIAGKRPLKIGVLGGSISAGAMATKKENSWFNVFVDWLASVSKQPVGRRNGAMPGTPSSFTVACLDTVMDHDVDLVFIEFCVNDGIDKNFFPNRIVASMEQLIRRVHNMPNKPAVVLMQAPIVDEHAGPYPVFAGPFHYTSADLEGALTDYYDVPSVCLRNALYELSELNPTDGYRVNQTFADRHPGDSGHKAMADLAVHLIQETFLDLVHYSIDAEEAKVAAGPLPRPMIDGNEAPFYSVCVWDKALEPYVIAMEGFSLVDEGRGDRSKWGFVGRKAGDWLRIRADTRHPGTDPTESYPIMFQYLESYENVGKARLTCVSACTCNPVDINAYSPGRVSLTKMMGISVSQAENCEIQFTILEETSTESQKFKVIGMIQTNPSSAKAFGRLWNP